MKRIFATAALLALTTTSAFAATTGSLLLQGIVAKKVSVLVTPQTVASALDLSTTQVDLKVGAVNVQSNSKTGYKLTISSANLGKLKRTDGPDVFSYSLKYGTAAVGLSTAGGTVFTDSSASIININKDINISYTGVAAESMIEGTYQDTITFDIASN